MHLYTEFIEEHPHWLFWSLAGVIFVVGIRIALGKRDKETLLDFEVNSNPVMTYGLTLALALFCYLMWTESTNMLVAGLVAGHMVVLSFFFQPKRLRWTVEEGCQNFLITGGIGSGKTNGINYLAWNLTSCQANWGGLWLDNKGNSHEDLRAILEKHGRGEDVKVLEVRGGGDRMYYNVLADPSFTPEALGAAIAEVSAEEGSKNAGFFKKQAALNCIEAIKGLRALGKTPTFTALYATLTNLDSTTQFIKELEQLDAAEGREIATHFESKFIAMPGNQFGGVVATITNCLYPFITKEVAEVTSSDKPNSFSFADMEEGKVLCLSLPQVHLEERMALNALLKRLFYQFGMMRYDRPQSGGALNVLALWLDEGHHSLRQGEAGDYMYLDRLRAARCAVFVGMQGPDSPVPKLGQDVTDATIKHLRSWFVFSPADSKAKKAVQDYVGKHEVLKTTRGFSGGRSTVSRSPSEEYILKDKELTGLKKHRCHIFHVGSKRLTKFVRLPHCEPAKGFVPNIE